MRFSIFLIILQAVTSTLYGICDFSYESRDYQISKVLVNDLRYTLSVRDSNACDLAIIAVCQTGTSDYPVIAFLDKDSMPTISLSRSLVNADQHIQLSSGMNERGCISSAQDTNDTTYWYRQLEDPGTLHFYKMQFFISGVETKWVIFNDERNASHIFVRDAKNMEIQASILPSKEAANTDRLVLKIISAQTNLTSIASTFVLLAASLIVDLDFNVSSRCKNANVFPHTEITQKMILDYLFSEVAMDRFQVADQGMLIVVLVGSLLAVTIFHIVHPAWSYYR